MYGVDSQWDSLQSNEHRPSHYRVIDYMTIVYVQFTELSQLQFQHSQFHNVQHSNQIHHLFSSPALNVQVTRTIYWQVTTASKSTSTIEVTIAAWQSQTNVGQTLCDYSPIMNMTHWTNWESKLKTLKALLVNENRNFRSISTIDVTGLSELVTSFTYYANPKHKMRNSFVW